jgi:hypothetical protein
MEPEIGFLDRPLYNLVLFIVGCRFIMCQINVHPSVEVGLDKCVVAIKVEAEFGS